MGRDKARIVLAGKTLAERALRVLDALCDETLLATGRTARYPELERRVVLDAPGEEGPLAGLAAALRAADTPLVATLPCDVPRLQGALLAALAERVRTDDLDVAVLASARGPEPTIAVLRRRVLPAVEASLAAGERRLVSYWPRSVDGRALVAGTFRPRELGLAALEPRDPARNLNTPAELADERAAWSGREVVA